MLDIITLGGKMRNALDSLLKLHEGGSRVRDGVAKAKDICLGCVLQLQN